MEMWAKMLHSICNMSTCGLPDMCALGPRACGPWASGRTYQADHLCPNTINVPLCMGRSKEKAGIHLKYYPEKRDTFEMYHGKIMHIIGG